LKVDHAAVANLVLPHAYWINEIKNKADEILELTPLFTKIQFTLQRKQTFCLSAFSTLMLLVTWKMVIKMVCVRD